MARGNNRGDVFLDDLDRATFLRHLDRVGSELGWRHHSYVLMGNHFHLLSEVPRDNLSAGMRDVLSGYARRFNWRRKRSGHVFSERFRSVAIRSEDQFVTTLQYIVRNPVRAGLVEDPREWPWSSVSHETPVELATVDGDMLLRALHPNRAMAAATLRHVILSEPRDWRAPVSNIIAALGVADGIPAAHEIGYSQEEIAAACGLSRSSVSRRIKGVRATRGRAAA